LNLKCPSEGQGGEQQSQGGEDGAGSVAVVALAAVKGARANANVRTCRAHLSAANTTSTVHPLVGDAENLAF
jgi:hypothetical protein